MSKLVKHHFTGQEEEEMSTPFEGLTDVEEYAYKFISSLALVAGVIVLCH